MLRSHRLLPSSLRPILRIIDVRRLVAVATHRVLFFANALATEG